MSTSDDKADLSAEKTGQAESANSDVGAPKPRSKPPAELGGPKGPEPTRYGDWERNGRCSDF